MLPSQGGVFLQTENALGAGPRMEDQANFHACAIQEHIYPPVELDCLRCTLIIEGRRSSSAATSPQAR